MIEELLVGLAMNTGLLIILWLLYLLLEYCWGGMSRFIGIILLPGKILHLAAHYLFAKIFGLKTFDVLRADLKTERSWAGIALSTEIYRKAPHKVYITVLAPLIITIPMLILMRWILIIAIAAGSKTAILIAWMTISIFVCGMPNLSDISFIGMYHVIKNPETVIALLWAPIVYVLGYLAYGFEVATIGVLVYIMLVLISSLIPLKKTLYVIEN